MILLDHLTRRRARILRAVQRAGSASQRDLVRATHLSASSVSVLCRQLLADGILEVAGTEANGVGRPLTWLRLAAEVGMAIGLCVSEEKITAVTIDLQGNVIAGWSGPLGECRDNDALITAVTGTVEAALRSEAGGAGPLLGIGIVLSGVVDHAEGMYRFCGRLPGVRDVPIRALLRAQFGVQVAVDDRARALAIAEHRYGVARGVRDFLYVVADTGVGAGLFLDGRPFRGTRGMAGEIGHLVVDPAGPWCNCGKRGCLETLAARPAIEHAAQQVRGSLLTPSLPAIAAAAQTGDQLAVSLLTTAGVHLGQGIAAALNLFGVELVVLGGPVPCASPLVVEALRRTTHGQTVAGINPRIELTTLAADAAARGAATLALDELFATDDHVLAQSALNVERAAAS